MKENKGLPGKREALRMAREELKKERHSTNPFMEGWEPDSVTRKKRVDLNVEPAFDKHGASIEGELRVPYQHTSLRYVKVVWPSLYSLTQLGRTAIRVLFYAMRQSLPNNATVWLPADEGMAFCRMTQKSSFYEGVAELVAFDVLARSERQGFYFINPRIFLNGNASKPIKNVFAKPTQPAI